MESIEITSAISDLFPEGVHVYPEYNPSIRGITLDSRKVEERYLFVAKAGSRLDGKDFIEEAIQKGASAILTEGKENAGFSVHESGCPIYTFDNLDSALGEIAARFYKNESCSAKIIGVTGTNGKTSVCHFLAQALGFCGYKVAILGTVGNGFLDALQQSTLTTEDVFSLHEQIYRYAKAGAEFICMEVSSHSLDQNRVAGIPFSCAVFTNLSQDHLDYHKDMYSYAKCKEKLFHYKGLQCAVIYLDSTGEAIYRELPEHLQTLTLGESEKCDLKVLNVNDSRAGLHIDFSFEETLFHLNNDFLSGEFNADNLLLVFLVLKQLGLSNQEACASLSKVKPVKGRLQKIEGEHGSDISVYVDYAHTPDGLEKVLASLDSRCRSEHVENKLILVFGCGGNRDKGKRKIMAQVAEHYADFIFVTSDNPRTEEQDQISQDIISGFSESFLEKVFLEEDRAIAIERAIMVANDGDTVLIAGKGHEQVQIFSDYQIEFSDQLVAEKALKERKVMELSS